MTDPTTLPDGPWGLAGLIAILASGAWGAWRVTGRAQQTQPETPAALLENLTSTVKEQQQRLSDQARAIGALQERERERAARDRRVDSHLIAVHRWIDVVYDPAKHTPPPRRPSWLLNHDGDD